MAACSFCGKQVKPGLGVRLFRKDGTSVLFCSHRCDKYASMGRKPAKLKWTKARKG